MTLFKFAEGLHDRQTAEAVRGRIDLGYALALPPTDPGLDSTVLSAFRSRLVEGGAEQVLLDAVLARTRAEPAVERRVSVDRFQLCSGCGACPEPLGVRHREDAPCPGRALPLQHLTGCGRMPSLIGRNATGTTSLMIAW